MLLTAMLRKSMASNNEHELDPPHHNPNSTVAPSRPRGLGSSGTGAVVRHLLAFIALVDDDWIFTA